MTCWMGSSHPSRYPAKFVDLVPCESEDKIFLACYVTTHTTEVSRDYVGGFFSS